MKLSYINTFDHEVPAVVSVMRNLDRRAFENLDITSPMDLYQRLDYMQRFLIGASLKKFKSGSVGVQAVGEGSRGRQVDSWRVGGAIYKRLLELV